MKVHDRVEEEGFPYSECLSENQSKILLRYVKNQANEARRKGATRAITNELIVSLILNTGLRASELCNLNIEDLPENHGENTIWVRDITRNVARKVDIDSEITSSLNKFVKLYRPNTKLGDPLFVSERGGRLPYMSLYSKLKIIGQKAGIGKLHPEILRHTYLVRLYDATQDLRLVQLQAGHVHSTSTARYVKINRQKAYAQFSSGDIKAEKGNQAATLTYEQTRTSGETASAPLDSDRVTVKCEACGKLIAVKVAIKIDSGQLLCQDCIKELRGHSN
jgi:site-specific recombinase XerD